MRLECEFSICGCVSYVGKGRCGHCNHGECWHRPSGQFDSPRLLVRRPIYNRMPVALPIIFRPMAPPIEPEEVYEYCESLIVLPV